jgi:hypothetical protein
MKPIDSKGLLLLAALGCAAGCSGGSDAGNGSESATLSISLMDAPVDDVTAVHVEITAIWIKSADDDVPPFELALEDAPVTVDLLELTEENAAVLVDGALIDAGAYEWLAMDVNAEIDNVLDSFVETKTGEIKEVFVPSGRVRLVDGFEVEANEAVQLLFDWDLRKGLVYPPGLGGGYILKPAFRIIDVTEFGSLSGEVLVMETVMNADYACNSDNEAENYDIGNVVYVFEGGDVVPDDIDEIGTEPFATVDATLSGADPTVYEYRTLLPFGDYTVAFTCQGGSDLAETSETGDADPMLDTVNFIGVQNVTISGATPDVTVDF